MLDPGLEECREPAVAKRPRLREPAPSLPLDCSLKEYVGPAAGDGLTKGKARSGLKDLPASMRHHLEGGAGVIQRNPVKIRLKNSIPVGMVLELRYDRSEQERQWGARKVLRGWLGSGLDRGGGEAPRSGPDERYLPNGDISHAINKNERGSTASAESGEESGGSFNFKRHLFGQLEVVGQFNKGFILTKLQVEESSMHLFIIDQHASDEKARFERLSGDLANVQTQELIAPLVIPLAPSQEQLVMSYRDVFEGNGFRFIFNRNSEIGSRIQLTHLPVILGVSLKQIDFVDLLSQLNKYKARMPAYSEKPRVCLDSGGGKALEENEEQEQDSISVQDHEKTSVTTLWCPSGSGLIPRPRKVWSILASK